jgi:hypothetical protein
MKRYLSKLRTPFRPSRFPDGHFYSPYPDLKDLGRRRDEVFDRSKRPIPGIDIREQDQLETMRILASHYPEIPHLEPDDSLRFTFENDAFGYTDSTVLACQLMRLRPSRLIEIGSGFSSAMTLDINSKRLDSGIELTFIEPYPKLLESLLSPGDQPEIIGKPLQEVDLGLFDRLEQGDVLFVDSTHVSKPGSDVNRIIFEILPRLNPGVVVHVHDIFYPFEYPIDWIRDHRAWNEDYLLRAFLQDNPKYEIDFFNHFMNLFHQPVMTDLLPLTSRDQGGSIWLRKIAS